VTRIGLDLSQASDGLRSELIFLPDDGSITRLMDADGDGFVILTPSNPGFWWGNSLRFDHAPRTGDFDRWMKAFETRVHAVQPASTHRTFGWDGDQRGEVAEFVDAGFEYFETIGLTADDPAAISAPHFNAAANLAPIAGDGWLRRQGLCGTLVEHASRYAFEHFDVDSLRISADENDVARRVYESCGYRVTSWHRGLERGS
jgi:hypothetical protein